ncbi:hypothetical protein [Enterobacter hormaechei]|uniref:hypothetical protein n=1 Tax=Enterobacter hormaechei TaxID=158836 RepID=UPI0007A890B4|nr:hypothetical protein [Enterobacter hormaechei]SAI93557.1 Uncharacterised protein [Enterobacter hormaechei]
MGEMADINDKLVRSVLIIDDGRDYTAHLVWKMGNRRDMRNGVSVPVPPAPKVAAVRVKAKKKPRKRGYRVVQKAIGAV